jgi:hypothetical protein
VEQKGSSFHGRDIVDCEVDMIFASLPDKQWHFYWCLTWELQHNKYHPACKVMISNSLLCAHEPRRYDLLAIQLQSNVSNINATKSKSMNPLTHSTLRDLIYSICSIFKVFGQLTTLVTTRMRARSPRQTRQEGTR